MTPKVPPTVPLPVIEALLNVASPEVESVEREVLPITSSVPPSVVFPVTANVALTVAAPAMPTLPPKFVAPVPRNE